MKKYAAITCNIILFAVLGVSPSVAQRDGCEKDGFQLMYRADVDGGAFRIWEENPGSSSSITKIERLDATESIIWDTQGERGCTQGVSRCYFTIPYALDGTPFGQIEAEMNWFSTSDENLMILSHIGEKITQTYFKNHPFQEFSLPPFDAPRNVTLQEADFEIPNVFRSADCPIH